MLITTTEELKELLLRAERAGVVALDTEFVWERTFYPELGLIQLAIEEETYLIDPLAIDDLSSLGELISNSAVVKILHDAQQDLVILTQNAGGTPKNIFDTRLAYGFCSDNSTLSLAALLEALLDIKLAKTESRTNWLQRPLSAKQLEYAADDVRYLTQAMRIIISRAEQQHTASWLKEAMSIYDDAALYRDAPPEAYFYKIRNREKLGRRQLAVLYDVSRWREIEARRRNRPRAHIISNQSLFDIAWKMPQQLQELRSVRQLHPRALERYGHTIIQLVAEVRQRSEAQLPELVKRPPRYRISKHILAAIAETAQKLNIDSALLSSPRQLNALLDMPKNVRKEQPLLRGWRREFIEQLDDKQLIRVIKGDEM